MEPKSCEEEGGELLSEEGVAGGDGAGLLSLRI